MKIRKQQFSSVAQSYPTLSEPMIAAQQASLPITNSQSSLKLTSIESMMPSSHLILGRPLLNQVACNCSFRSAFCHSEPLRRLSMVLSMICLRQWCLFVYAVENNVETN